MTNRREFSAVVVPYRKVTVNMQTHKRKRLRRKKEKSVRVVVLGICELERGQNCNYRGVHVNDGHFGASECRSGTAEKRGLLKRRE